MVLVKRVTPRGFEFYTNYGSRKAQDLDANPYAALLFYWPHLARQVRAEGPVHRLTPTENCTYFAQRPRGSRIGAWASRQSEEVSSRRALLEQFERFRERFSGTDVPCPDFWGGYRLDPAHIEFWQGRPDRLHERCCYLRQQDGWRQVTLMP
jgi:pyridoxamine 5'-phosphate oxidase